MGRPCFKNSRMVSVWSPLVTMSPRPMLPYRVVDDEAGVLHPGGVRRLGTDAVRLRPDEDAVAAVGAAAHDEIDGHGRLAVRRHAQHDPTAGIGIAPQQGT